MRNKKYFLLITVLLLGIAGSLYFVSINPDRFGFYHDDGIYLVTAKALATGQGYKILSLPDEPLQTKYPPVFPFTLSILWRANPEFPDNLFLFSVLSALSTLVFLTLAVAYLVKRSYANPIQALLILLFTALNWRTVILATSILSEPLFTALSLCVLWLVSSQSEKHIAAKSLGIGLLLSLAVLTRLAGVSLLVASLLYALKRRKLRRFLLPIVFSSLIIGGWFLWCHLNNSSSVSAHTAYYTDYYKDWASLIYPDESSAQHSLLKPVFIMIGKNIATLLASIPVVCFGMPIDWLQDTNEGWQFAAILIGLFTLLFAVIGFCKTRSIGNGLLHFYILTYIALHLIWPYRLFDRFLIPILPFLLLFVLVGGSHLLHGCLVSLSLNNRSTKFSSLFFVYTIFVSLFAAAGMGLSFGLYDQLKNYKAVYASEAEEKKQVIEWLKANSLRDDVLICGQDPIYFLYTGIKATRLPIPNQNESIKSYADRLQSSIGPNNVTLLLQTANDFSLDANPKPIRAILADAINSQSSKYYPVFSTSNNKGTLYRVASGSR